MVSKQASSKNTHMYRATKLLNREENDLDIVGVLGNDAMTDSYSFCVHKLLVGFAVAAVEP